MNLALKGSANVLYPSVDRMQRLGSSSNLHSRPSAEGSQQFPNHGKKQQMGNEKPPSNMLTEDSLVSSPSIERATSMSDCSLTTNESLAKSDESISRKKEGECVEAGEPQNFLVPKFIWNFPAHDERINLIELQKAAFSSACN